MVGLSLSLRLTGFGKIESVPADALPISNNRVDVDNGRVHYVREYRDALGRPLAGELVLTGTVRTDADGKMTVPVPVRVNLSDSGVLDVHLPPDRYTVQEVLRTADGVRCQGSAVIVVEEPSPL